MNNLPDELYQHIYKYLKPKCPEYMYSVIWCKKCGELFKGGDWFINLNNSSYMLYNCSYCKYDNIFNNDKDWMILLDNLK